MTLAGLLLVVFIVLKLTGVIAWSWWWVVSPLWISLLLQAVAFFVTLGVLRFFEKRINR